MEFWSKGLGKKTIALGLTRGESLLSEDSLCLKGVLEEPITWEYVMLLEETDIVDFFEILREPTLASYVHGSPNRWHLYAGLVKGGAQLAWRVISLALRHRFGTAVQEERVAIQLPPPSVIKKKSKKKVLYRRRLSTSSLAAPSMTPAPSAVETARAERA